MNFFLYAFRARFKTAAVNKPFVAAFFLLAAAVLALGLIFNHPGGLSLRVGVLETDAPVALRTLKSLRYYSEGFCEIVGYGDGETMRLDVSARKIDCAYVITPGAEGLETKGAIIAYRSPATVAGRVMDLIVAAAYLENFAGELGREVLTPLITEMENVYPEKIPADLQSRADAYLKDGALMEMVLAETGGAVLNAPEPAPYRRLFHGLVGLFGWLLALLCAMGLAGDTDRAVLNRLKTAGRGGWAFQFAGMCVLFAVTAAFTFVTVAAGGVFYPGLTAGMGKEILMGFSYAAALTGVASLFAALARAEAFPALIMFAFIFAALLGGAFFDIREVLAQAGFTRFLFPPYYYLEGTVGSATGMPWPQAAILAGIGATAGWAAGAAD
ncbi:MAG: hypothetical protein LBR83_10945 [Clostridiales bacterium]|nr:hypothetical protein [Clostridiales bacterium]